MRDPGRPFAWGRRGAGPSSLGKSLLVAGLGRAAACPGCWGTGRLTGLPGADEMVPWLTIHDAMPAADITECGRCDGDGLDVNPAVYRQFTDDLVTGWPACRDWRITRAEVLAWLERQHVDPVLAVTAAGVPR